MSKVYCSVGSCAYNAIDKNICTLKNIQVCPCKAVSRGTPEDETCCSNYKQADK